MTNLPADPDWQPGNFEEQPMPVSSNPSKPIKREPNCKPGDPADAKGLVHAWKLVTDNGPGDVYECERCGQTDVD